MKKLSNTDIELQKKRCLKKACTNGCKWEYKSQYQTSIMSCGCPSHFAELRRFRLFERNQVKLILKLFFPEMIC